MASSTNTPEKSTQLNLFRPVPRHRRKRSGPPLHADASDVERAAAESIKDLTPILRVEALSAIRDAGPAGETNKSLGRRRAAQLGKSPDDASCRYAMAPRCTELRDADYIVDSGRRSEGCIVWVATPKVGDGSDLSA